MRPDETMQERLARMAAEGLLSEAQAERLRASLGRTAATETRPDRAPRGHQLLWGLTALGLLAIAGLFASLSGGGDPAVQDVTQTLNQPGAHGEMNKSLQAMLAIAILVILPVLVTVWSYNGLVTKEERVFEAWAQTESTLQRRADLVPALVETVSRYLKHEAATLEGVTEARAQSLQALADNLETLTRAQEEQAALMREHGAAILDQDETLGALFAAQGRLGQGLSGLVAVAEAYPDLRSGDQFLELLAQLEGSENRINIARLRFNEAVRAFNGALRRLPGSLVAGLGGFQRKAYFRSEAEARDAPELAF